jgi:hypothetical protein
MRVPVYLIALAVLATTCPAQNRLSLDDYSNSEMIQRWNSTTQKAIAAYSQDQPGKKKKVDPLLQNRFQNKSFEGGRGGFGKNFADQRGFVYNEKVSTEKFGTRSFLGLKNPWFGKKVVETPKAGLWSKSAVANIDKKVAVESAQTREYYQADKKVPGRTTSLTIRPTEMEGKAQGFVDSVSQQQTLTIEQVRELLNKR